MEYQVSEEELQLLRSFEDGEGAGLAGFDGDRSLNSFSTVEATNGYPRLSHPWSWKDVLTCDVCDPLSEYYEIRARAGRRRRRSLLPRLFYVVSSAQMLLLILATLSVSGSFCGFSSGPGGLQSGPDSLHGGSIGGVVVPVQKKPLRELPQQHAKVNHSVKAKLLLLQTHERAAPHPRLRMATALHAADFLQKKAEAPTIQQSKRKHEPPKLTFKDRSSDKSSSQRGKTHRVGPSGPTAFEAIVSKLHNRWSSLEDSIRLHAVGDPMPLTINCNKCVASHHPSSTASPTKGSWRFRPSSIVLGAMVPIFLSAAIIIIIGVMAVSNFILAGPHRLAFYFALVVILTIFSCHRD